MIWFSHKLNVRHCPKFTDLVYTVNIQLFLHILLIHHCLAMISRKKVSTQSLICCRCTVTAQTQYLVNTMRKRRQVTTKRDHSNSIHHKMNTWYIPQYNLLYFQIKNLSSFWHTTYSHPQILFLKLEQTWYGAVEWSDQTIDRFYTYLLAVSACYVGLVARFLLFFLILEWESSMHCTYAIKQFKMLHMYNIDLIVFWLIYKLLILHQLINSFSNRFSVWTSFECFI